jgi:hypothetical protein
MIINPEWNWNQSCPRLKLRRRRQRKLSQREFRYRTERYRKTCTVALYLLALKQLGAASLLSATFLHEAVRATPVKNQRCRVRRVKRQNAVSKCHSANVLPPKLPRLEFRNLSLQLPNNVLDQAILRKGHLKQII